MGIVIATIVGATETVSWRVSIGCAAVPAAVMFALVTRLPESPRWFVKSDDKDAARAALERVRAEDSDLDAEMEEICSLERGERDATHRGWDGLRQRWVRPALIVGCGIAIFTQLSGIEMIIYYAPTILTDGSS